MSEHDDHSSKKVAILIENSVEDEEFQVPYKALQMAGIEVVVLGSRINEKYTGKQSKVSLQADGTTTEAIASQYDAVVILGDMAPDTMRTNPNTVCFVKEAMEQGKIVAAVCHGAQVLISADVLKGKATGFNSIRQDIINAGAEYYDQQLVVDENLITSRQPGDLAIFTTAILSRLGYGGKEVDLADEKDRNPEWWKLADAWGGSRKSEIVKALNTALAGERYSQEAFEQYAQKTSDAELTSLLQDMIQNKKHHIQKLEVRLEQLGEKPSLAAAAADKYAWLKTSFQGSDDLDLFRYTLGDLQTGIVDTYTLQTKLTDPVSTHLFTEIKVDLGKYEQCLAQLYRQRRTDAILPGKPTTVAAVTM